MEREINNATTATKVKLPSLPLYNYTLFGEETPFFETGTESSESRREEGKIEVPRERGSLVDIEQLLAAARQYLAKNDPVQASEKLYKVTEDCLKLLAKHYNLPEFGEARRQKTWWSRLIGSVAKRLVDRTGKEEFNQAWTHAFDIHRFGFHENAYTVDQIKPSIRYIEWLLDFTKQEVKNDQ